MSEAPPAPESTSEVLARARDHAARVCADLTRQRASLLAADPKRLPPGVDPAEGVDALDEVIAAARAVMAAASEVTIPDPTAP